MAARQPEREGICNGRHRPESTRRLKFKQLKLVVWLLLALLHQNVGSNWRAESQAAAANATSTNPMRILALFSGTKNDLGLDHRLGRQVLKLAVNKAKQLHGPQLAGGDIELSILSDDTDCTSLNTIPSKVAEQFYSQGVEAAECAARRQQNQLSGGKQEAPPISTESCSSQRELELRELDLILDQAADRRRLARHSSGRDLSDDPDPDPDHRRPNRNRIDAIIGPSCDFLVDLVARMASYWRTPIYSATSISANFARKEVYSTLTRLSPSIDHLSMFMVKTLERFKWRHLAIIVDTSQVEQTIVLDNFERTINRERNLVAGSGVERKVFPFSSFRRQQQQLGGGAGSSSSSNQTRLYDDGNESTQQPVQADGGGQPAVAGSACSPEAKELLLAARRVARVFLLLLNEPQVVRRLLLCAYEFHMNNGEYAFLALNLGLKSSQAVASVGATVAAGSRTTMRRRREQVKSYEDDEAAEKQRQQQQQSDSSRRNESRPRRRLRRMGAGSRVNGAQTFDWYSPDDEENNLKVRQMFESLMLFSVEVPIGDEHDYFVEQTLDMAHQEFPEVIFERSSVGPVAVALHDSLLLAVEAHLRQQQQQRENSTATASEGLYLERPSPNGGGGELRDQDEQQYTTDTDENDNLRRRRPVALMWNERYSNGLIAGMHINSNGDQELDYVLSDLEPEMGIMRPVAAYSKETRQVEPLAGSYIQWPKRVNPLTKELVQNELAPPDEPECGFNEDADRCIDRQNLHAALSILAVLAALVLASASASLYKYRQIKYQMQLDDYWWKINWPDLQFIQANESLNSAVGTAQSVARALRSGGSVVSAGSDGASSFVSLVVAKPPAHHKGAKLAGGGDDAPPTSAANLEAPNRPGSRPAVRRRGGLPLIVTQDADTAAGAQSVVGGGAADSRHSLHSASKAASLVPGSCMIRSEFSSVVRASNLAMYKGELVIVKQLNGTSIQVTRELLVELRSMREHINDNLAKFMGLCVEPERLAIVYEYCSRGSLQDMLLNESVAMDWTLKYSIIGDIVSGLNFIHTTLLDYHGRLKSTNLVLDSRFTVKVTDFGLQNLYSQLDAIKDQNEDEEDEDDGEVDHDDDDGDHDQLGELGASTIGGTPLGRRAAHRKSLAVSVSAYNMDSVSVRGDENRSGGGGERRLKLKNRGAVRYFWTAPEHLREKNLHFAGSKKGDVYSLAIIFYELLTRKEPYYYGTNAKPNWPVIKRERLAMQATTGNLGHLGAGGDGVASSVSGPRGSVAMGRIGGGHSEVSSGSMGGSSLGHQAKRMVHSKLRRTSASVGPQQPLRNAVGAGKGAAGSQVAEAAETESVASGSVVSQLSGGDRELATQAAVPHRPIRPSVGAISEEPLGATLAEDAGGLMGSVVHTTASGNKINKRNPTTTATNEKEALDAEEILDQLRMGIQPEPVRPYIPNYVHHGGASPKLIELMRACWNESPAARPSVGQVRNLLRRITKGVASKNYLDNLLERLQNYAADLERIVDAKSGDIMEEKLRTEELLYQLVPKFVADRLKCNEPIIPQVFDGVTIFFSDIVGFEKYASLMSPCELVDLLNSIYSSFESIISSFDVTKIETIIDQFLVASGISFDGHEGQATAPAGRTAAALASAGGGNPAGEKPANGGATVGDGPDPTTKASKSKRMGILSSLRRSGSHATTDNETPANMSLDLSLAGDEAGKAVEASPAAGGGSGLDLSHYSRSSAEQIARMALCIRDLVKSFHFRQSLGTSATAAATAASNTGGQNETTDGQPGAPTAESGGRSVGTIVATSFNIRIGIHSGRVCAGIVGVKRPKFCLIGDTVNVASRMHTNSKANRIQISGDTKELLELVPGFNIEPRGRIEVKGKGMMETYWLESSY